MDERQQKKKVQLGLLLDPDFNEEIERLAHKMGMSSRPPFVIYVLTEAIRADLDGRPLFQPQAPQVPSVEPGLLVRLTGELGKLVDRLKTVLRAHDQRDAELTSLAATNAEAIREAQQQLAGRMRDWLDSGIDPYTQQMDKLAAVVADQGEAWGRMIQNHCDAMAKMMIDHQGFRSIAAELRKQREIIEAGWPDVNFHIGANWHFSGLRLLGVLAVAFVASFFVLVFVARSLPADWIAAPAATMLLGNEERAICVLSGNHFTSSGRCINLSEVRS